MELKPVQLGKKMELRYIPFSELVIPWEVSISSAARIQKSSSDVRYLGALTTGTATRGNSSVFQAMKQEDLEALKYSIVQFGLLKPFEVAELLEELNYFFGKGKFVIIDGQRRYFALRELLRLPSEHKEGSPQAVPQEHSVRNTIEKVEKQAQKQLEKLSVRDYVLVPCLVYPYKTYLQMMRHNIEDKRFSDKPPRDYIEVAETMHQEGILDINPDDLDKLWETRNRIREERQAIEQTLQEIKRRMSQELDLEN